MTFSTSAPLEAVDNPNSLLALEAGSTALSRLISWALIDGDVFDPVDDLLAPSIPDIASMDAAASQAATGEAGELDWFATAAEAVVEAVENSFSECDSCFEGREAQQDVIGSDELRQAFACGDEAVMATTDASKQNPFDERVEDVVKDAVAATTDASKQDLFDERVEEAVEADNLDEFGSIAMEKGDKGDDDFEHEGGIEGFIEMEGEVEDSDSVASD